MADENTVEENEETSGDGSEEQQETSGNGSDGEEAGPAQMGLSAEQINSMTEGQLVGHLKLALPESLLEQFNRQTRVLNAGRPKGQKLWTPNSLLLSYAVRALNEHGPMEAAAAQIIADQRAAENAAIQAQTKEQKEQIKAQKAAEKLAIKAKAAADKAAALAQQAAMASSAATTASNAADQVQIDQEAAKKKPATKQMKDDEASLAAAESELVGQA